MARNNRPPTEEYLDDFEVMYVEAVDGLDGAQAAIQRLGRGGSTASGAGGSSGPSTANATGPCVIPRDVEEPAILGLETWTVPGGRYARRKMVDWESRAHTIGAEFEAMVEEHSWDETRPSIEFYRSLRG